MGSVGGRGVRGKRVVMATAEGAGGTCFASTRLAPTCVDGVLAVPVVPPQERHSSRIRTGVLTMVHAGVAKRQLTCVRWSESPGGDGRSSHSDGSAETRPVVC
jgi:hypothetical protein